MTLKRPKQLWVLTSSVVALALTSCASGSSLTNLTPAYVYGTPAIFSDPDPQARTSDYRTFSVFPFSVVSEDAKTNGIMDKPLLFFLRNCLEYKGYRFVPLDQNPDFLATMAVSSEYEESYVPPSTQTLPVWVPGRTITSYGNKSGTFDYNTYGSYSSYGWGSYSGESSTTTHVPGYMGTEEYTRPGSTVGNYYPTATVSVFDAKSMENVWFATGAVASDNPDARVSSQYVVTNIFKRFPNSVVESQTRSDGVVGVGLFILTNDGNNYFPTVLSVSRGGPAARAGIKVYDMILSIDGAQVVNKPFSEIIKLLRGDPGTPVTLRLWRTGKQIEVTMTRVREDELKREK